MNESEGMRKAKESLTVMKTSRILISCDAYDCFRFETVYEDEEMSSERAQAWGVATGKGWTHDSDVTWSCPKCSEGA